MERTNVMRLLTQHQIDYTVHSYDPQCTDGQSIAKLLAEDEMRVFKTLVTVANSGEHLVFVIPVCSTLHLKKAAEAAQVKNIVMIKQKELLPLTGYIHGGCSPIDMKKLFRTFVEESAMLHETIYISAGKVGFQVELSASDLFQIVPCTYADLI